MAGIILIFISFEQKARFFCIFVVMLKRYIIITSLILSYAVVFSHSVIPHHHHDHHEVSENKASDHHHHDNDHEDDDNGLSHQFASYFHSGTTTDFHEPNCNISSDHFLTPYVLTFFQFNSGIAESPPPPLCNDPVPVSNACLFVKGLRAPPVLIG